MTLLYDSITVMSIRNLLFVINFVAVLLKMLYYDITVISVWTKQGKE